MQILSHGETGFRSRRRRRGCRSIEPSFDDLRCASDQVEPCVEQGIELLIDDSPMSIVGALERGIMAATILHPWNEEICEEEDVICARDWPGLARLLAPLLGARAFFSPPARVGAG